MQLRSLSKPSHTKVLILFCPSWYLNSLTSIATPQQQDWWAERAFSIPPLSRMPAKLFHIIQERVDIPMLLSVARKNHPDVGRAQAIFIIFKDAAHALTAETW
ncbi:hypothetical protein BX070DRAFT_59859 [Coemansia spiralis]|nr:hypothetical protein BX070DRAFT_59859 [Coemansia spiralis]